MKYLLFMGGESTGKTKAITRFRDKLIEKGFKCTREEFYPNKEDFMATLEKGELKIVIGSASDTLSIIKQFKAFCKDEKDYSIVITSARIEDDLYKDTIREFAITDEDTYFEIPLATLISDTNNNLIGEERYKEKVDKLASYLFKQL
ncbi:MAG: hypothetical protein ACRC4W_05380 [Treponemataceae bacterium]